MELKREEEKCFLPSNVPWGESGLGLFEEGILGAGGHRREERKR
jgi:hypothetical protein